MCDFGSNPNVGSIEHALADFANLLARLDTRGATSSHRTRWLFLFGPRGSAVAAAGRHQRNPSVPVSQGGRPRNSTQSSLGEENNGGP